MVNWQLRRDWAALGGGGTVAAFNGADYTAFGCGPTGAIDQSLGSGWGSDSPINASDAEAPKFVTVKLPQAGQHQRDRGRSDAHVRRRRQRLDR